MENTIPTVINPIDIYEPYLAEYWDMHKDRVFYIDDEITADILTLQKHIISINMEDADHNIEVSKRKPIRILINSPGGFLTESLMIANTIEMSKTPIYTINIGEASSGASLILMSGHKRYAMKYSHALIHSGSGVLQGTYESTVEQQKSYQKQVNQMYDFILNHSTIGEAKFKKMKTKEWFMDASEQLDYGIVDKIITDLSIITGEV